MKQKAFTLIELLVVIAIIGVIASIVLVNLKGSRQKAKIAGGLQFSHTIHHTVGAYTVGTWSLDDSVADSEVTDVSGYENHCTFVGGPVPTKGILGNALYFDGEDDYLDCNNPDWLDITGNKITLSAWMKLHSWPSTEYAPIVSKNWHYIIRTLTTNGYRFSARLRTSDGTVAFNHPVTLNTWYHVALTYNGSIAEFYVNGISASSTSLTGNIVPTTDHVLIGAYLTSGDDHFFPGIIDEVRIYNVGLAVAEIQKHYAEGLERYKLAGK